MTLDFVRARAALARAVKAGDVAGETAARAEMRTAQAELAIRRAIDAGMTRDHRRYLQSVLAENDDEEGDSAAA